MTLVESVTLGLSALTVGANVFIIFVLAGWAYQRMGGKVPGDLASLFEFVFRHGIQFSLIVAMTAMLGSLFYSDVAMYEPCRLCWYQRIFMYPLVPLFALALWKKDKGIIKYGIGLALPGALLAAYHYAGQVWRVVSLACAPGSADCSVRFFFTFGYITIPMMSLSAFVLIIVLLLARRRFK